MILLEEDIGGTSQASSGDGSEPKTLQDWQNLYDSASLAKDKESVIENFITKEYPTAGGIHETFSQEIAELGFTDNMFISYVDNLLKSGISLNGGDVAKYYAAMHNLISSGVVEEDDLTGKSPDKMDSIVFNADMFNGTHSPDDCTFIVKAYYWLTSSNEVGSNVDNIEAVRIMTGDPKATVDSISRHNYSPEMMKMRDYIIYVNHTGGTVNSYSDIRTTLESLHTGEGKTLDRGGRTITVPSRPSDSSKWQKGWDASGLKLSSDKERSDLISWLLSQQTGEVKV